ncbi:sce7726 family protein [Roseovarius mucosus]|uniref:sce7726 family protein n=1 Tax=Roseovarius mucosus TaxID=215743 RepID=UPI0011B775BE|nr:sce7726 family protein [Roseovarius mucosus]MBW4976027.1 sce7726 family protein [Roseovarius mucosus]
MGAFKTNSERRIRAALRKCHLRHASVQHDVLMIDELGLAHAKSRIDLAVFNGHLHGYEIKSAGDTLDRLPRQLAVYTGALQKLTLVIATRHLDMAETIAPNWCGLTEIVEGPRGGITFASRRRARANPDLDPYMLAHLLWHPEAQDLLRARGASKADVNAPRKHLYRLLADEVPVRELAPAIKAAMASRTGWRDHQRPS